MSPKVKRIVMFVLLAFVVASVAFLAAKGPSQPPAPTGEASDEAGAGPPGTDETRDPSPKAGSEGRPVEAAGAGERKVIVYYFHTTRRCFSCKTLEQLTKDAISGEFGEALRSGLLEWKPVNTDESGNKHFLKDYGLYTKSVVVSEYVGGNQVRHKVLQKAWLLLREKDEFLKYIQDEVRAYLEGS